VWPHPALSESLASRFRQQLQWTHHFSGKGTVAMKYIRVNWKHQYPDEPVTLYSELDDGRWEVRKVEVFRDGRIGYASAEEQSGGTYLGELPTPELSEIGEDPEFDPLEITQVEFEFVWNGRKSHV
jgi:hypothetical protein